MDSMSERAAKAKSAKIYWKMQFWRGGGHKYPVFGIGFSMMTLMGGGGEWSDRSVRFGGGKGMLLPAEITHRERERERAIIHFDVCFARFEKMEKWWKMMSMGGSKYQWENIVHFRSFFFDHQKKKSAQIGICFEAKLKKLIFVRIEEAAKT